MKNLLRKPVGIALIAVIALAIISSLYRAVADRERRAELREKDATEIATAAVELESLRQKITAMETALSGEPIIQTVEQVFGAERVNISATQSAGSQTIGPYKDALTTVRFQNAALGPFHRILGNLEAARPALIVREMSVLRSIDYPNRLDADLTLAVLQPGGSGE